MTEWRPYQACCFAAAIDKETAFCNGCGRPLFRCAAFDACRNLVNPFDFCASCLRPEGFIDKDVHLQAKVGEVTTLGFRLRNASPAQRSLSVLGVLKSEGRGNSEPVPLQWEKIDPGQERPFSVVTEPLQSGGAHRLQLMLILATRFAELEEHYVFTGEVLIKVSTGSAPTQIVQNFDLSNSDFGTAGMVVANPNLQYRDERPTSGSSPQERLNLDRAERFELERGYRGYAASGLRVPRNVRFEYAGFPAGDAPFSGPLIGHRPLLRCGRDSRRFDAERNPQPNDLCLRAYEGGRLDADTSGILSRHLCDFILQNDRLYVRSHAEQRLGLNAAPMSRGELRVVEDGDRFTLPAMHAKAFEVGVRFSVSSSVVDTIRFERRPAANG